MAKTCICFKETYYVYSRLPLSKIQSKDTIQDPQWVPETVTSTESYIYYAFTYT